MFPRLKQFSLSFVFEAKVLGISGVRALALVDASRDCNSDIDTNDFFNQNSVIASLTSY